jgi:hypothetical protein
MALILRANSQENLLRGRRKGLDSRSSLELAGGIVLVFLGAIFVYGFGIGVQNLVTDAIFILFGALLIRNAYNKSAKGYSPNSKGQQRGTPKQKTRKKPS